MLIGDALFKRIAQMPEIAFDLDLLDFHVGDRRQKLRVPVDEAFVLVDQTLFVEGDENLENRLREPVVHREPFARPVAGST